MDSKCALVPVGTTGVSGLILSILFHRVVSRNAAFWMSRKQEPDVTVHINFPQFRFESPLMLNGNNLNKYSMFSFSSGRFSMLLCDEIPERLSEPSRSTIYASMHGYFFSVGTKGYVIWSKFIPLATIF